MSGRTQKPVHPAASALLILFTLAGVQWAWWRFLIYHPPGRPGGPQGPPGSGGPPDVQIEGRPDVLVNTYTGDATPGDSDGPPHAARFDRPTGLALDARGNLYVADTGNNRIRVVSTDRETTTLAGSDAGYADGPALSARFRAPCGVCVGPDGSVYVADTGNHCIRRIKDGQVTTIVGGSANRPASGGEGLGLPVSISLRLGEKPLLVVADASRRKVLQFTLDGASGSHRDVDGTPVEAIDDTEAIAVPDKGTIVLGSTSLRNAPFDATDEYSAAQAARITLKRPVGLFPLGHGWLVTDDTHGAVLMVVGNKVRVLAGYCTSRDRVRGLRDGDGSNAMFGVLSCVVADGKRYAYVADTGNNSIRRLDIGDVALP